MSNSQQDGTTIVPNTELAVIIKANNLPDELGSKIQEHFSGTFSQLAEWQEKANSIVITSEDQVAEIALANDGRKAMVKVRTTIEKVRKELKDPYFRMGQTIDAVAKALTAKIEPIESDLKAKADYAVNLAAERRAKLMAERKLALEQVGHVGELVGLADLPEETFQMILSGAKEKARLAREAAEREQADREAAELAARLEAERIANAERVLNARIMRLLEIGAKRGESPVPYLQIGELAMSLDSLAELQEESFDLLVGEFQAEADRIKAREIELQAKKDRYNARIKTLIALGAIELDMDSLELARIELGTSKVMHMDLAELNETDPRWDFTLESFTAERDRLAQIEADKQRAQQERLQVANDRLAQLREVGCSTAFATVADLTDVEFSTLLQVKTNEFNASKEAQRITNLGLMRKPLLDAQGEFRSADFLGQLDHAEFDAMLENATRLKALADQDKAKEAAQAAIEAQRKADEAARVQAEQEARKKAESATDKEKLEAMVKQIQAIVMPTCSSAQGDAIARGTIERLAKLVGHINEAIAKM